MLSIISTLSPVSNSDMSAAAEPQQDSLSRSSLTTAREAIARWTMGKVAPVRAEGLKHVSPQQRWVEQTQRDLRTWISEGGFSQNDMAPSSNPAMWKWDPTRSCID